VSSISAGGPGGHEQMVDGCARSSAAQLRSRTPEPGRASSTMIIPARLEGLGGFFDGLLAARHTQIWRGRAANSSINRSIRSSRSRFAN